MNNNEILRPFENNPHDSEKRKALLSSILVEGYTVDLSQEIAQNTEYFIEEIVIETTTGIENNEDDQSILNKIKQNPAFFSDNLPDFEDPVLINIILQIRFLWTVNIELLPYFDIR